LESKKVFRVFAEIFLQKEHFASVMCCSGLQISDRYSRSWTPWWSDSDNTWNYQTHSPFRAGGPSTTQRAILKPNGISIFGYKVDTVADVCPVHSVRDGLSSKIASMIRDATPLIAKLKPHRTQEEIEAELIQLIFLDLSDIVSKEMAAVESLANVKFGYVLDFISGRFNEAFDLGAVARRPRFIKFILANGLGKLIDEPSYAKVLRDHNDEARDGVVLA
jgi:hypothetical protein